MASASHDEDDEDFEEYNPHPYQGGYDIALTYGHPLPPSPTTCYPISSAASPPPPPSFADLPKPSSPLPLPPPPESGHLPEHHSPLPLPQPVPVVESDHRSPYDYGDSGYRPVNDSPDLDLFGFWPFLNSDEEIGYWNQWRRAGNYLFGYSEGYGERRIGVDSYGIPIYANKVQSSQPLSLEIEPARDWKVDYYREEGDNENRFSAYDVKDESYGYAYNRHYYEDPLHAKEDLIEPILHQRLNDHEVYEEQPKLEWHTSYSAQGEEKTFYGNPQYAYERHYKEQPLCVELEPYKPTWSQYLSYQEDYGGMESLQSNSTSYSARGDENKFYGNPQYAYERHYKEQSLCVELEPYKPTWSQNLSYQDVYGGMVSLYSNWNSSGDNGMRCESNTFEDPNYTYVRDYYEQPPSVELEPFKPAWSQNQNFSVPDVLEISQSSWADSLKEYGTQYFSPFLKDSQYDE